MSQSHCESSPGSLDECRLSANIRPSQTTWAVSPPVGCYRPHLPSLFYYYSARSTNWRNKIKVQIFKKNRITFLNISDNRMQCVLYHFLGFASSRPTHDTDLLDRLPPRYDTIRYDTRCYFNVRSKPAWVSLISQRLRFVLTILALYKFVCMYVCM